MNTNARVTFTRAVAAATALAVGLAVLFQQSVLPVSAQERAAALRPSPPTEGIKVHGAWVIEIREPDGTLVERREFQNDLSSAAVTVLGPLLVGNTVIGSWSVILSNTSGGNRACDDSGTAVPCIIEEPPGSFSAPNRVPNLGVARTELVLCSAQDPVTREVLAIPCRRGIVLTGNATAGRNGRIDVVATYVGSCPAADGNNCNNYFDSTRDMFTSREFTDSPIDVVQGQIVQVTVTISFS